MENKIPLPTDNIYKFYALFSLLLFIFSLAAVLHVTNSTNDLVLETVVEVENLKQESNPTPPQEIRRAALERKMEIALSNRKFFQWALGVLIGCSVLGISYGFRKWHTEIQPVLDETAKIQLEIARAELADIRKRQDDNR